MKAAWCSGLESADLKTQVFQVVAQRRKAVSHPTARLVLQAHVQQPAHESSRSDNDSSTFDHQPEVRLNATSAVIANQNPDDVSLLQIETGLPFQNGLGAELIRFFVTLRPRRPDAWTFLRVQHPELDRCRVGI